jgi:hypothetical protein
MMEDSLKFPVFGRRGTPLAGPPGSEKFDKSYLMRKNSTIITTAEPWVPTNIGGCVLWLRSDLGVTKDGGNLVSSWADQSGLGNDVTQGNAAKQPLWIDAQLNGYPVITCDGTDNILVGDSFSDFLTPLKFLIFGIWKQNGERQFGCVYKETLDGFPYIYHYIIKGSFDFEIGDSLGLGWGNSFGADGAYHYWTWNYDGTTHIVRMDGVEKINAETTGVDPLFFENLNRVCLGGVETDSLQEYGGINIAEFGIYNQSISGGSLATLENYLANRSGL